MNEKKNQLSVIYVDDFIDIYVVLQMIAPHLLCHFRLIFRCDAFADVKHSLLFGAGPFLSITFHIKFCCKFWTKRCIPLSLSSVLIVINMRKHPKLRIKHHFIYDLFWILSAYFDPNLTRNHHRFAVRWLMSSVNTIKLNQLNYTARARMIPIIKKPSTVFGLDFYEKCFRMNINFMLLLNMFFFLHLCIRWRNQATLDLLCSFDAHAFHFIFN